jgi:hypothetical protein
VILPSADRITLPAGPERRWYTFGILSLMGVTTIKVDSSVRDRLAALAEHDGRSLGDEVAALVALRESQQWFDQLRHAMEAMTERDWMEYWSESARPDDGLDDAREEWPEFNRADAA